MAKKRRFPTLRKSGKILREGKARGRALTKRQKGFFGLIRGGGTPSKHKGFRG